MERKIVIVIGILVALYASILAGRWGWMRIPISRRHPLRALAGYLVLSLFAILFVGPFVWMLSTSLKTDSQVLTSETHWIPTVPTQKLHKTDENGISQEVYQPVMRTTAAVIFQSTHSQSTHSQSTHSTEPQESPQASEKPEEPERTGRQVVVIDEREDGTSLVQETIGGKLGRMGTVRSSDLRPVHSISPQWHNYPDALTSFPFLRYTVNTLIICVLSMLGTVISAALPAYGFARLRWKGRDLLFVILLATIMLPPQVTMLPVFLIFRALGWTGTMLPLIVPAFFGSAFYIFLLRQFFLTVPQELSDAARIDGCSELGILWRILTPIAQPALATVALLSFTAAWMDFSGPLIYLHDERTYTLAIGLLAFLGRHNGEWNLLMAASMVMTLPMLVLFFFAQRTYIQGIALTGLKG